MQCGEQFAAAVWFGQKVGLRGQMVCLWGVQARGQQDWELDPFAPQLADHAEAVATGHLHIAEDQIHVRMPRQLLHGFVRCTCRQHAVAIGGEHVGGELAYGLIVFHQKNGGQGACCAHNAVTAEC